MFSTPTPVHVDGTAGGGGGLKQDRDSVQEGGTREPPFLPAFCHWVPQQPAEPAFRPPGKQALLSAPPKLSHL